MWLADQIDAKGIGSGMSLIIFCGIISNFAQTFWQIAFLFQQAAGTAVTSTGAPAGEAQPSLWVAVPVIIMVFVGMFVLIVATNAAERRIPVQYAKRVVGRKMYGGQSTNIPIKVNLTGVLPVIFATSFMSLPGTIKDLANISEGFWADFLGFFTTQSWGYAVIYALLIIGFNYFYVTVQYNPIQMANDLRKNSGMIPGIRPGQPTSAFIQKVISKVTFIGGLFLVLVTILPIVITRVTLYMYPPEGINIAIGGTSLLIVVGVAIEISNTLESYMLMRHHKGFLE
jgi:preprotein translocase subunit SecY